MSKPIYELPGIYYKQGDDLRALLDEHGTPYAALRAWAAALADGADRLRTIAAVIEGLDVEITADTHEVDFRALSDESFVALEKLARAGRLIPNLIEDEKE